MAKSLKRPKVIAKPIGNTFEFYFPKQKGIKPQPIKKPSKKDPTKLAYNEPAEFLKKNFKKGTSVSFGIGPKKNLLARYPALPLSQIVRAALECGYGRKSMWSSHLLLNPKESKELAVYLLSRLMMVVSCIKVDNDNAYVTHDFYSKIEPSEKVAISFIVGGIGSYVTAKHWFDAAGEKLKVMLHASIYTKGYSHTVNRNNLTSKKSPDYLIESSNGEWHVFESKGGTDNGRHKRIQEGLLQLVEITHLAWKGGHLKPVTTSVCTHTSINSGSRLKILAYDPPADDHVEKEPIELDMAVCKLLKVAESLDQFHALSTESNCEEDWLWKSVSQMKKLKIALPCQYLDLEVELRARLGIYLLVREVVDLYKKRASWSASTIIEEIARKVASFRLEDEYMNIANIFLSSVRELINVKEPSEFIARCHQKIELEKLMLMYDAVLEKAIMNLNVSNINYMNDENTHAMTSSGMFIRELKSKE